MTTALGVLPHTVPEVLLAERRSAIDTAGWGRPFVFYQPRNLAFWTYVILVTIGFGSFAQALATFDAGQTMAAAAVFILYGAVFWCLMQRTDRYTGLPRKLLVAGLLWGGFAAAWAMAANANTALGDIYGKKFGQTFSLNWSDGLSAPITEELANGAGLLLLIALAPRIVRTAFDGFIIGLAIGLGFQILEDMIYALQAPTSFGSTILIRLTGGVAGHFAYTAIFCAGMVYLLGRPAEARNVKRGLVLMAIPPILHFLWDAAAAIARGTPLWMPLTLVTGVLTLIVFFRVFALTAPRERALLRTVMAPEVAAGVLTEDELDAMAGDRKLRSAYRRAHSKDKRKARNIVGAGYDLASALAHSAGTETPRVQFARSELIRIRAGTPSPR